MLSGAFGDKNVGNPRVSNIIVIIILVFFSPFFSGADKYDYLTVMILRIRIARKQ